MYKVYYKRLSLGLIFLLISIRLQGIDILPDIIGYIIMAAALAKLECQHKLFGRAKVCSFILMPFSLLSLHKGSYNSVEFSLSSTSIIILAVSLLMWIVDLVMAYYIFQAIIYLAEEQRSILAQSADFRCKVYIFVNGLYMFFMPFLFNIREYMHWLSILFIIPVFVLELLFIGIINGFGNEQIENAGFDSVNY